ncbi:MAG: methyltransferase domain-containing protein [Actinomycetota bacterium]|nr:methyltransferase domain-containing protein [Actinomycetota bacterium]
MREQVAEHQRDALVERLFESAIGMMEIVTVYLGDRLGLYRALADHGPATPADLAARTGTHERYAREWLEQQASAGILNVDAADADAEARRYILPEAHAEALLDRDSLSYTTPITWQLVGVVRPLDALLEAFKTGGGVPYAQYGADMREGIAYANRAMFVNLMGTEWLPAIPDVHERLRDDPPARVADVGCGTGWSSIAIARAYPKARVDGFDLDEESLAEARANAEAEGLADRVRFQVRDAADPDLSGRYDLAIAVECIHDMSRPVQALRAMRGLVGESGVALVVDERVGEGFAAPGDEIERLMYGFSVLHCLPVGMAEQPSAGTGTVMRPSTLRRYALEAGFSDAEILPIEHDLWRFYRLVTGDPRPDVSERGPSGTA